MKKLLLSSLLTFATVFVFGQTQIGGDIDGEAAGDKSSFAMAISDDGTIVAIGAPYNDPSTSLVNSGHVRVYKYNDTDWVQMGNDIDGEATDTLLGYSLALSSDGSIVAIGTPFNAPSPSLTKAGQVKVYKYNSTNWTQMGETIDGEGAGDYFGDCVAISDNGEFLAIGAPRNDDAGDNAGRVKVYQYTTKTGVTTKSWEQFGGDIDGVPGDGLGWKVSLSGDASTIATSAVYKARDYNGLVRVYKNKSGSWTKVGSDFVGEARNDWFGNALSLSTNGAVLAVGAEGSEGEGFFGCGRTKVYQYSSSAYAQIGNDIDGESPSDYSSSSVSLSSDGTILAIGADGNDDAVSNAGHVRIYKYVVDTWTKDDDIDGENSGDVSGECVALSADGTKVAIGAINNDDAGSNAGHVRVYNLSTPDLVSSPTLTKYSLYPNPVGEYVKVAGLSSSQHFTIYSSLGIKVKEGKLRPDEQIGVKQLNTGLYLLQLGNGFAGKFLKK